MRLLDTKDFSSFTLGEPTFLDELVDLQGELGAK
jgi:hypothetical protein